MKKFNLIPVFFALIMAVFFLVSCEKEDVTNPINSTTVLDKSSKDSHTPIDVSKAPYQKEITTKGIGESRRYDFTFKIASNDANLLRSFDNSSITFEFLNDKAVGDILQQSSPSTDMQNNEKPSMGDDVTVRNSNTYVAVTLIKINSPLELATLPAYDMRLSEKALDAIRAMKAQTIFDFGEIQVYSSDNSRACSPCSIWNNNKVVKILADCGSVGTRTDNYWAYTNSNTIYYLNSSNWNNVAGNYTGFKCNSIISSCCVNSSAWVRRVLVLQDVVTGLYGMNANCIYGSWCGPSSSSNCSGYYPNGCY